MSNQLLKDNLKIKTLCKKGKQKYLIVPDLKIQLRLYSNWDPRIKDWNL